MSKCLFLEVVKLKPLACLEFVQHDMWRIPLLGLLKNVKYSLDCTNQKYLTFTLQHNSMPLPDCSWVCTVGMLQIRTAGGAALVWIPNLHWWQEFVEFCWKPLEIQIVKCNQICLSFMKLIWLRKFDTRNVIWFRICHLCFSLWLHPNVLGIYETHTRNLLRVGWWSI